jgi:hypothetical protein
LRAFCDKIVYWNQHHVFSAKAFDDSLALAGGKASWRTEAVTISMHQSSVGVFVPFLANLSGLLDRAAGYAELRKIDPAILLDMRL